MSSTTQIQSAARTIQDNIAHVITGTRIIEPTEVSVMNPTVGPTLTLVSCYPYLVDTQRIVVFAELKKSTGRKGDKESLPVSCLPVCHNLYESGSSRYHAGNHSVRAIPCHGPCLYAAETP